MKLSFGVVFPLILLGAAMVSWGLVTLADPRRGAATQPGTQPTTGPAIVNKFCPVQRENPVDVRGQTAEYAGKTYGFCCDDCVGPFKADPEKYAKDAK